MRTSKQWLSEVKNNPTKLEAWLKRQYVGEKLAAVRIKHLAEIAPHATGKRLLERVAHDEALHSEWIGTLLETRGIPFPEVDYKEDRYWKIVRSGERSFEEVAACGHLAEEMRLMRIRAISEDSEIAEDIRLTFVRILKDEEFHVNAFGCLTDQRSIDKMRSRHEEGMRALGLAA